MSEIKFEIPKKIGYFPSPLRVELFLRGPAAAPPGRNAAGIPLAEAKDVPRQNATPKAHPKKHRAGGAGRRKEFEARRKKKSSWYGSGASLLQGGLAIASPDRLV